MLIPRLFVLPLSGAVADSPGLRKIDVLVLTNLEADTFSIFVADTRKNSLSSFSTGVIIIPIMLSLFSPQ